MSHPDIQHTLLPYSSSGSIQINNLIEVREQTASLLDKYISHMNKLLLVF